MTAADVAEAHQANLIRVSDRASTKAVSLWRRMDFNDLDSSWAAIADEMTLQTMAAQFAVVSAADKYTTALSSQYGVASSADRIVPEAFVGVDGSGRPVGSLLEGSVYATKDAVKAGLGRTLSMQAGSAYLAAMVSTALADVARSADQASGIAQGYSLSARVVEPGACSRCIVLAGATQFGPFLRHPKCRCTMQVIPGGFDGVKDSNAVADAMSNAQQDRAFGKAGAEAIRSGADVSKVVSARRGARKGMTTATGKQGQITRMQRVTVGYRPDGSAIRVFTTSEGATVRGAFGRRAQQFQGGVVRMNGARYSSTTRVRLMPESVMELTKDAAERRILLIDAGYINPSGGSGAQIVQSITDARSQADAIYRRLGITIG